MAVITGHSRASLPAEEPEMCRVCNEGGNKRGSGSSFSECFHPEICLVESQSTAQVNSLGYQSLLQIVQPLVIIVNTIGAKIMKMVPGEVGRAGLKVHCEFRKDEEKGQM